MRNPGRAKSIRPDGRLGRAGKDKWLLDARDDECKACLLNRSSTNVCIMGRGNPMSPIMLIGEAPGANEEQTGQPFTGVSGQRLQKMLIRLRMSGLVYITNVVKCRPPANRTPTSREIIRCRPYMRSQFSIVKPHVVVALGVTARNALGWTDIKNFPRHRRTYSSSHLGFTSFCTWTWHPAYCLRQPSAWSDVARTLRWAKLHAKSIGLRGSPNYTEKS